MEREFDAIVIGAGLLGLSTAAALKSMGKRVVVLEAQSGVHHEEGSSHGHSRIMRILFGETAVFEDTAAASREAMIAMGVPYRPIPGLFIIKRDPNSATYKGLRAQLEKHLKKAPAELDAHDVREKFGLIMRDDDTAFIDPEAGGFNPYKLLDLLHEKILVPPNEGAIRFDARVVAWNYDGQSVAVETAEGHRHTAEQLVIATGAWTAELISRGQLNADLVQRFVDIQTIERIPLFYFDYPRGMKEQVIPVTFLDGEDKVDMYAIPDEIDGELRTLKVGFHYGTHYGHPDDVCRNVHKLEERGARLYMEKLLREDLTLRRSVICLYAGTKDDDIPLIGPLPGADNVFLAAYGSGNCAKHAVTLGQELARQMYGIDEIYSLKAFSPQARLYPQPK